MLSEIVRVFTEWVGSLVSTGGPLGIFLVALMENLFPPTPSEFLYPLAGKLAYDGALTLFEVILAGLLGTLLGATLLYFLGYQLGGASTRQFIERYGVLRLGRFRIHILDTETYDRALALFETRGGVIVMFGRILPLVHGIVSIPAGVTRMNLFKFYLYTSIGSLLWIGTLAVLGYLLGTQWSLILQWLDAYQTLVMALMAVVAGYLIVRTIYHQRQAHLARSANLDHAPQP